MGFFEIVCSLALVGYFLYRYLTSNFDYWKKRGVDGPKPLPFFGNVKDVVFGRLSLGHYIKQVYGTYDTEPVVGIFLGSKPVLVVRDPEMIKAILIKDFSNFPERGLPLNEKRDPLSGNLFGLEAERWRPLRAKLSPVFTTGKLKDMCALIAECAVHLQEYLGTLVSKDEPIEVRDLTAKYTTDVIGSCAFGIDMKSLSDEESEFRKMGKLIFHPNTSRALRFKLQQISPLVANIIAHLFPDRRTDDFFMRLTLETMEYRKKHNIVRNDFINILMELKAHPETMDIKLTDSLLVAQALIFFAAGFETSSTTMSNALYELAVNQDIQDKLRQEIREGIKRNNGDLRYENVKEMRYLDCVFKETLRKYPPAQSLLRKSMADYTFEDTKLTISAGQGCWISIHGIQTNPKIYPNPEIFDPSRFTPEEEAKRHPMDYLPFGDGPRNCIGSRFAVYQTKIGLIKILESFKVNVSEKTEIPYEIDPKALILSPKNGLPLRFSKLEEPHI